MGFISALRSLRNTPALSLGVVLLVGLGIGANLAVFSLINALFLAPLPVHGPDSLAALQNLTPQGHPRAFSYPMFERLHSSQDAFSELMAWAAPLLSLDRGDGETSTNALLVSGGFFGVLEIDPLLGRPIAEQDLERQAKVALISYSLWEREFGLDPEIVGKEIRVQQTPVEVIGVLGPEFTGLDVGMSFDLALPLSSFQPGGLPFQAPEMLWLNLWGRLKPDATLAQAEVRLQALWPQILRDSAPPSYSGQRRETFLAQKLKIAAAGKGFSPLRQLYRRPLAFLMGLTGLMLIISCLNAAMLLLIRASGNASGWAVRLSMGASRWQIVAQGLREAFVLAALGAMAGLLVSYWASQALPAFLTLQGVAPQLDLAADSRMGLFLIAIVLSTVLLAGFLPSLRVFQLDLAELLRGNPGGAGRRNGRVSGIATILQVALSMLLVMVAGSLIQSLQQLKSQELGFEYRQLLVVRLAAQPQNSREMDFTAYYQQLLENVRSLPGVRSASFIHPPPLMPIQMDSIISRQEYTPAPGEDMSADRSYVSPGFLETIGTPLMSGRGFTRLDNAQSAKAALINQAMAKRFFGGEEALGKRFRLGSDLDEEIRVVGVLQDAKLRGVRDQVRPAFYLACPQYPHLRELTLLVRAERPRDMAHSIIAEIDALGVERAFHVTTVAERLSALLNQDRVLATVSSLFGILMLVVTCSGVYGIAANRAILRLREFGIRMALGARRSHILWLVFGNSLSLLAAGLALGAALGTALSVLLAGFIFGLEGSDPLLFALSAGLVGAACAGATCFPALKASRSDPLQTLRRD